MKNSSLKEKKTYQSVKISSSLYQKLQKIVSEIKENGWQHIGASRRDTATSNSVLDEALICLSRRRDGAK